MKRHEEGITLIALIITIIILIILTAITISNVMGSNLFGLARGATENYIDAGKEEQKELNKVSEEISSVVESLKPMVVIDEGEVASKLKEYQGKYVDIGLDLDDDGQTTNDWELFYAGNGRIYLIAAYYVKASKLEEWQVIGDSGKLKDVGFKRMSSSNEYWVYWSSSLLSFLPLPTTPNDYLDLVMHTGYDLTKNQRIGNAEAVSQLLNKDAWSGIKDAADKKDCIDFVIAGPTIEMWCAAWNEAVKEDENGFVEIMAKSNISGYCLSSTYRKEEDSLYVNGTKSYPSSEQREKLGTEYKTFFPPSVSEDDCDVYWLASPGVVDSYWVMSVSATSGNIGRRRL